MSGIQKFKMAEAEIKEVLGEIREEMEYAHERGEFKATSQLSALKERLITVNNAVLKDPETRPIATRYLGTGITDLLEIITQMEGRGRLERTSTKPSQG